MSDPHLISITVNGVRHETVVEARRSLADVLRHDLGLTGTHIGCEHGICGTCTVLVDGEAARACLLFAVQLDGAEITTVEGLGRPDDLHPLLQCGYCTPGFLMLATALLRDNPHPTDEEIRAAMSANLCRCTGYAGILAAVRAAADA